MWRSTAQLTVLLVLPALGCGGSSLPTYEAPKDINDARGYCHKLENTFTGDSTDGTLSIAAAVLAALGGAMGGGSGLYVAGKDTPSANDAHVAGWLAVGGTVVAALGGAGFVAWSDSAATKAHAHEQIEDKLMQDGDSADPREVAGSCFHIVVDAINKNRADRVRQLGQMIRQVATETQKIRDDAKAAAQSGGQLPAAQQAALLDAADAAAKAAEGAHQLVDFELSKECRGRGTDSTCVEVLRDSGRDIQHVDAWVEEAQDLASRVQSPDRPKPPRPPRPRPGPPPPTPKPPPPHPAPPMPTPGPAPAPTSGPAPAPSGPAPTSTSGPAPAPSGPAPTSTSGTAPAPVPAPR